MANIQIPNLPAAISLNGSEQLEAVQAGTTRRITTAQIVGLAQGTPIPFPVSIGGTGASTFTAGYLKADADNPFTTVATIPNTDITGLGTMSTQNANSVTISGGSVTGVTLSSSSAVLSGGSINGMSIGATTPSTGVFTDLTVSGTFLINGNLVIGDSSADTLTINSTILPGVVISGSSASAALRVTQTGAGDAILVEDSSNPDSSPFVVRADGRVGIGEDVPLFNLQVAAINASTLTQMGVTSTNYSSDFKSVYIQYSDSSTTGTTYGITNAGLGSLLFQNTSNALIGTNGGCPIIFATTSLERMRITSTGNVGIGSAGVAGQTLVVGKSMTGGTAVYGVISNGTILSDATSYAALFFSNANTASNAGVPYTVSAIRHYEAFQGAFNADSTVTSQRGFSSLSSLIGATNNFGFVAENTAAVTAGRVAYGFYSDVNTATGGGTAYGFFANGTAPNIFPNINGGIAANSTLTLQSTRGVGTTDSILFRVGNNGAVTALTIDTTGASTFGVSATSPSFTATRSTSATATSGAFAYGTMSYSDTNMIANFTSASTSYNQIVVQNTSAGATASANVNVSNDTATATTNFVELGINSSTFSGTGAFGAPNYSYVASASTDLAIGTYGANAIHFVVNTGATDAMTISSAGAVSITSTLDITTSATVPIINGGSAAASSLTLRSTSGAGTTDAIVMRTASQSERVRVDSSGVVTFWQPAQTSLAAAATLTAAQVRTRIVQYTGAAATVTLPTGTTLDTVIASGMAVDTAFELTFINTSANLLTIGANGNTTVGLLTVAANTSGTFRFRKTATNTFTVYRVA